MNILWILRKYTSKQMCFLMEMTTVKNTPFNFFYHHMIAWTGSPGIKSPKWCKKKYLCMVQNYALN